MTREQQAVALLKIAFNDLNSVCMKVEQLLEDGKVSKLPDIVDDLGLSVTGMAEMMEEYLGIAPEMDDCDCPMNFPEDETKLS